jgi:DNA-binding transcriptional regulator YiaG
MATTRTSARKAQKPVRVPKKAVKAQARPAAKKPVAAKLVDALNAVAATEVPRKKAGLSIKLFSRLTGFSERAIASWEAGEPVSEPARRRLLEIERFRTRLAEVVKADRIPAWLETPNPAFDGLKPVEVIERGEIDRLWNMIFYMESGVAT